MKRLLHLLIVFAFLAALLPATMVQGQATEILKPTASTPSGAGTSTNPEYAYDGTTGGENITCNTITLQGAGNNEVFSVTYHTWSSPSQTHTARRLCVRREGTGTWGNDTWAIEYSVNGGTDWFVIEELLKAVAKGNTAAVTIGTALDLPTNLQVKITITGAGQSDPGVAVNIWDVWLEGDYTAAAAEGSVTQGITISDGVTTTVAAGRNVSQGITISDGVTAAFGQGRNVSQGITISDGVTAAFGQGRNVSQGITMADGVTVAIGAGRDISQTMGLSATTSAEASFSRLVNQGITVADGVTAAVGRGRNVSQGITVADGVTAAVGRAKDVSQTMSLSATTSTAASFKRSVSQGITIADGVTATPAVYRPVTQGITVSDGVTATVGKWSPRDVSQGITVSDGVTATVTITPPTPGGDEENGPPPAIYAKTNLFGTTARIPIRIDGILLKTIKATSEDGMLTITIPAGTIVLDEDGNPPSTLTSDVDVSPPSLPEEDNIIGLAYDFGPPGVTFDPPITFTWSYAPDTLPEGVAEEDLVIAYYDEDAGEWLELPSTVDPVTHIITAPVSHFATFAIIGAVTPPPPSAPAAFSVTNLSVKPLEVEPKEAVTITVWVANTGGTEGSYSVVLKINGVTEAEKSVTVAAGDNRSVSFTVSKKDAGSYNVVVDGLSGSFTVVAPAIVPPPVPPPVPAPVPPPAPPVPPPPEVIPPPAPPNWPLIGGVIAGVVVVGLLVFFLSRRRISILIYTALPKFRALVALLAAAKPKGALFIRRIISYIISHVKH